MFNFINIQPEKSFFNNIILYEPINIERCKLLMSSKLLRSSFNNPMVKYPNEYLQLSKYIKNYNEKTKCVKVVYSRSMENFGRVNPHKSLGLHSIRRELRQTLCRDELIDIDIVNAHPVILNQICEKFKLIGFDIKNKYLDQYVNNRDNILKNIIQEFDVSKDLAKQLIIRLLYLGSFKKWQSENNNNNHNDTKLIIFLNNFSSEIVNISKIIINSNSELYKFCKIKNNHNLLKDSSIISYYLQTVENKVLETVFKYSKSINLINNNVVLSNDGLMIPNINNVNVDDILTKFNQIVNKELNLNLKFTKKEFTQYYSDEEIIANQFDTEHIDQYFKLLEVSSHHFFAKKFIDIFEHELYIYNTSSGWYEYNMNNILINTGNRCPLSLMNYISEILQEDLKKMMLLTVEKFNPIDPKFKHYNKIYIQNYKYLGNVKFKECIVEELKYHYSDEDISDKLDNKQELIAFKNKVFDFSQNTYRSINKNDYVYTYCNYLAPENINIEIRNELKQIIYSIFEDNKLISFFYDSLGFSLFTNKFEKLHIWSGCGSNGKGLIMNLIQKCFCNYFYIPDSNFLTVKYKAQSANSSLFNTRNKKLVMVSEPENETESDVKFNIEFVKKITGRDSITTRAMYKDNITFTPKFTLFLQCNEKPKLDKIENAIKRRLLCLDFPLKFVHNPKLSHERHIDFSLKDKLNNIIYYSEFMGLLISEIRGKFHDNLFVPDIITNNTEQYLEDNDVVKQYINEYYDFTHNNKITIKDLFTHFLTVNQSLTITKFRYNLKNQGLIIKTTNKGMSVFGIKQKPAEIEQDSDEE